MIAFATPIPTETTWKRRFLYVKTHGWPTWVQDIGYFYPCFDPLHNINYLTVEGAIDAAIEREVVQDIPTDQGGK